MPIGQEFRINTYTTLGQNSPSVSSDAEGNLVVVWDGASLQEDQIGVFGQLYSSDGNPIGSEFHINTFTPAFPERSAVAADASGKFVVVWSGRGHGENSGIFGQRFRVGPTDTPTPAPMATATETPTPRSLPSGTSMSQTISVTDHVQALELMFQVTAPPTPEGCHIIVVVQFPSGQSIAFPMTNDLQIQTFEQPQAGIWLFTVQSNHQCPESLYSLSVHIVPAAGTTPLSMLLITVLSGAFLIHRIKLGRSTN